MIAWKVKSKRAVSNRPRDADQEDLIHVYHTICYALLHCNISLLAVPCHAAMRTLLPWPQATDFAGATPLLLEAAHEPRVSTASKTNTAKSSRDIRAASPTRTQHLSHLVASQLALGRTSRNTPCGKAKLARWLRTAANLSSSPLVTTPIQLSLAGVYLRYLPIHKLVDHLVHMPLRPCCTGYFL